MEEGIGVGIKKGNTTNWYKAHSITRGPDGRLYVYCTDENRTTYIIPAKNFAGVSPSLLDYNKQVYPDMLNHPELEAYKGGN